MEPEILAAVIGATVGGAFASLTPLLSSFIENRKAKRSIRRAFAGEISAIIAATKEAKLEQKLSDLKNKLDEEGDFSVPIIFNESLDHDPIFNAYIERIGLLTPKEAADIALFYRIIRLSRFQYVQFQGDKLELGKREGFRAALSHLEQGVKYVAGSSGLVKTLSR